jgi:hypothetical protein
MRPKIARARGAITSPAVRLSRRSFTRGACRAWVAAEVRACIAQSVIGQPRRLGAHELPVQGARRGGRRANSPSRVTVQAHVLRERRLSISTRRRVAVADPTDQAYPEAPGCHEPLGPSSIGSPTACQPALLEDEQLVESSADHDPARWTIAAQMSSKRGERHVHLLVAWRRALGLHQGALITSPCLRPS